MFVKICGITNIEDAYFCAESGADAIGLNFYRKSKRYIELDDAAAIVREVCPYVTTVGIMVQPSMDDVEAVVDAADIDAIQVYEPRFDIRSFELKKLLYYSVRIRNTEDLRKAAELSADLIFIDAFVEGEFGGTGMKADWHSIRESGIELSTRFVLSGGLTPENVCEAIGIVGPHGVDTASGVESFPGKKDHNKIREFISNAKQCRT